MLQYDIPEIASFCRFNRATWNEKVTVEANGKVFLEPSYMLADPSFFQVFSFPLTKRDPDKVLDAGSSWTTG